MPRQPRFKSAEGKSVQRFMDALLRRYSSTYMNRMDHYGHEYFAHYIRHANAWYGFVMRRYYHYVASQYMAMAEPLGIRPGDRVLDIGCGVGLLVEQFGKLGYEAIGVDVHKTAIDLSVCPRRCSLVTSTAQLNYPDGYFDLVVSREVLEHISGIEIDACISEWRRIGKGAMVHVIAVAERGYSATQDPTHINVRPQAWWIDKFRSHGYSVIGAATTPWSPFGSWGCLRMRANSSSGLAPT